MPVGQLVSTIARYDAHPPLYYLLLHFATGPNPTEPRARLLSVLAGLASVLMIYLLARKLFGSAAALASAFLMATSAFHVYYSQEARFHALATFLCLLSWYLLLLGVRRPGGSVFWLWCAHCAVNAASVYCFYYSAFSVAAQGVYVLITAIRGHRRALVHWIASGLGSAALFAPWIPVMANTMARMRALAPPSAAWVFSGRTLLTSLEEFLTGYQPLATGYAQLLLAAISLLSLASALIFLVRRREELLFCASGLFVPFAIVAVLPLTPHVFESKHLIFASPFVFIMAGSLFATARSRLLPITALVVVFYANAAALWFYFQPTTQKEDWRAVAQHLAQSDPSVDGLCLNPPQLRFPLGLYAKRPLLKVEAPVASAPADFSGLEPRIRRVWLVESVSNVSIPNPAVAEWFQTHWTLRQRKDWYGMRGHIAVLLFERPSF
jgi:uncharacterized membrane protein